MVTITENTRRITAIRECIAIASSFQGETSEGPYVGIALTGWDIARLSMMYEHGVEREPTQMLYRLTGVWMA